MGIRRGVVVALVVAASVAGAAPLPTSEDIARAALRDATVALEPMGCAGVVVDDPTLVVTARHCVDDAPSVYVRTASGTRRRAWVAAVDRVADQAVLFVEEALPVAPLALALREKRPGAVLYFSGHPKRPRFQEAALKRVGRCPSLPALPDALFTSIHGTPGDSGSPVVDGAGRVVGLVHGGARCEIVTPARTLQRLLDRLLDRPIVV
jgi:S1-C subfamily serine protease